MDEPIRILLVDRDKVASRNLEHVLVRDGHEVTRLSGGQVALQYLEERVGDPCLFEVILADLELDSVDEGYFILHCRKFQPVTELIFIADKISVPSVVDAIRQGAFHYLGKPVRPVDLRQTVQRAAEQSRHKQLQQGIRQKLAGQEPQLPMTTRNPKMLALFEQARRVAPLDLPILITGETGTGKELLARYIHDCSNRSRKPFVAVNCGAFNEELLTNELFGHGREAFTGATRDHKGLVESAHGGTLFLDEITEMSLAMQVKLLRVIQEKELRRLGMTNPVNVDVRFLAASNRQMQREVEEGRFRRDLYYRINVIDLKLPPLSERQDDIPVLVEYFLNKFAERLNKPVGSIALSALERLSQHSFPGNVRELENILLRALVLANGPEVTLTDFPDYLQEESHPIFKRMDNRLLSLEEMEATYILWVCEQLNGNQTMAAKILGLDRVSLWRRMKKIQTNASHSAADNSPEPT
ncbi:MAG: sigma-54-dependent Fis family transcriptional regulator [Magnetococcales bacterium]|nr:sigma-54-dependent Fis family transcriptional regulator [Magnetococcales bacterium]